MSARWMRVARGLAAAAIATFVAAFSHAAAGGGAPGQAGLALAAAFAVVVCVLFTRRSPSLPLLSASVVLSQLAFHLLFAVGAGADAGSGGAQAGLGFSGAHAGHASMTGSGPLSSGLLSSGAAPDAVAGSGAHLHGSGWMWLAHAVAALATIVLLRRGELVLRRLVELGRVRGSQVAAGIGVRLTALVRVLDLLVAAEKRPQALRISAAARPASDRLRDLGVVFGALRHRGPPRGFVVHLSA